MGKKRVSGKDKKGSIKDRTEGPKGTKAVASVGNRGIVVVGALLIQICLGSIYAYSTFSKPINADFSSSVLQLQAPFAAGLASFAAVMVIAGKWQDKVGPRIVASVGGIVLGIGIMLAGLAPNIIVLTIAYGIIGGAGIGLAYVCPIAALVKWFPDKKGLISGVAVAGFGAGALIIAQVGNIIMADPVPSDEIGYLKTEIGDLTTDDTSILQGISDEDDDLAIESMVNNATHGNHTTDDSDQYLKLRSAIYKKFDWSKAFFILGAVYLVTVLIGAQTLRNPPEGYRPKGWNPPAAKPGAAVVKVDYKWNEMMRTPQYWLLWLMFVLGATAGLMVIGNIGKFAADEASIGAAQIATIVGVLAIFNGAGRVVWGAVSDKIGRPATLLAMYVISGIFMAILFNLQEFMMLMVGASMIGFCFGGNFAMYPSATADFFGTKFVGLNYGLVFTAYGVAGITGAVVAGFMVDITGSYYTTFIIMAVLCFVAAGLSMICRSPQAQKEAEAKKKAKKVEDSEE